MASNPSLADEKYSDREIEILHLLADGLTNKEISQKLILSLETIKWYNKGIYSKLGVNSRTQAAAAAGELGLFEQNHKKPAMSPAGDRYILPAQITSFVGRGREVKEVRELLQISRLVTLTGPPGTGKTRLSLEVARRSSVNFPDGLIFVGLAGISNSDLVGNTIAGELGLAVQPDQPVIATIQNFLRHRRLLLILDNFEHLLDAALVVSDLLVSTTHLRLMITSREALNLSGEYEYVVPPLAKPDLGRSTSFDQLSESESVLLFTQRARSVQSNFCLTEENIESVAKICLRLDGLPLPIELAAARIKMFNPEQLLTRLEKRMQLLTSGSRDLHPHQRTLRATIDWSHNLLDNKEKVFFSRLGVFTGGRSIDAVDSICTPGLNVDVIDGLASLVNKSLVVQSEGPTGEPRFYMLETIHEYAEERLSEIGEQELIRERHNEYFVALVEDIEPGYRQSNQIYLMNQTEAEMGNIRSAFFWGLENSDSELSARIVNAILYFLSYSNYVTEGYNWIMQVIVHLSSLSKETQVRSLASAGRMNHVYGHLDQAKRFRKDSLDLARELGDRQAEGWALVHLAVDSIFNPLEREMAIALCEEGLGIMRELHDKPGMAQALNNLGELFRASGDYERARFVYEECLAICLETGELIRQIIIYTNLAFVAYRDEDYHAAQDLNENAILGWKEIGSMQGVVTTLPSLTGPICQLGEPEKAVRIMAASEKLMADMGYSNQPSDLVEINLYKSDILNQLGEAAYSKGWSEGESMTLEQTMELAQIPL